MTALFKKYKWAILYWAILLFLLLFFAPGQEKYYLDQDIKQFRTQYLIPALVWLFGLLAVGLFIFRLLKTKSIKESVIGFLTTALTFGLIIFLFQSLFLGFALFANRQITKGKVAKIYHASFMEGTDHSKDNFHPYEPSTGKIIDDRKLINELYQPGLKEDDKISLPMKIGLLGIAYSSHPLNEIY